jgi:hypothetical protein
MVKLLRWVVIFVVALPLQVGATKLLIPMDAEGQTNHLKAYGIAFKTLQASKGVDWLLNYRGGSFAMEFSTDLASWCKERDVAFSKLSDKDYKDIVKEVMGLKYKGDVIKLEKAPKIAVYTPSNKKPWDDAVTLALTYAEIPFDKLYVTEALNGELSQYDWLHLHHEDFTGQYGKFWAQFRAAQWYIADQNAAEALAAKSGFKKVAQMQLAVVKKILAFVASGGNLFAMCSATDTYDIALAADGVDISETQFDGDPMDDNAQSKLNFKKCMAFKDFTLNTSPYEYEYANIDNTNFRKVPEAVDFFTLSSFPVQPDPVPAMLTQNHTNRIKAFMGQTTAFRKEVLKANVITLADNKEANEARYIHSDYGRGTWTFYGGHDPEDYQHAVGDPTTTLAFHTSSPGYRLILNNVLFPAAKRTAVPTVSCCDDVAAKNELAPGTAPAGNGLNLVPDPATSNIIIKVPPTFSRPVTVLVTNTKGDPIISKIFNSGDIVINLQEHPSGVYNVQVNGQYAGRVTKN